jgi:hypothetical protein
MTLITLVYISYMYTKGKYLQLCLVTSWGKLKEKQSKIRFYNFILRVL